MQQARLWHGQSVQLTAPSPTEQQQLKAGCCPWREVEQLAGQRSLESGNTQVTDLREGGCAALGGGMAATPRSGKASSV